MLPKAAVVSPDGADDGAETEFVPPNAPMRPSEPARVPLGSATGQVRLPDSIPRRAGVLGDIGYLFRVISHSRAAKRELATIEKKIEVEKEARSQKLIELARHAIGDDDLDQTFVGRARHRLLKIEESRSRHAGKIAAAREKIEHLERKRREERIEKQSEISRLQVELKAIDGSLAPLIKRHSQARRRASSIRSQLAIIDEKIARREASLVSVNGPADTAAVAAEVASLRAERESIATEEPPLAAEVDDLEPKIASLQATQQELQKKLSEAEEGESEQDERVAERVEAVKANRLVEERRVKDLSSERQGALLDLGEALHAEKPATVETRLKGVERHDLAIGTMERRALELRELRSTIETAFVIRGVLWIVLGGALIAAVLLLALMLR
jgi:chromosome segregation ATPase